MTRRELREHCFKMLFCTNFYPAEEAGEQLERYFETPEEDETTPEGVSQILHQVDMDEKDQAYLLKKTKAMAEHVTGLDARINEVAQGWKTSRMGKVDLTLIRLAVYEMKYEEDVPVGVAINEAVELAKSYGTDDSASFVNGILGSFVRGETIPDPVGLGAQAPAAGVQEGETL